MYKTIYLIPFLFLACQSSENGDSEIISENLTEQLDTPDESETADTSVPMDLGLRKVKAVDLPDLDYAGNFNDCWYWEDKNGENYFIRTLEEPQLHPENSEGWETTDQYLHVYHYIVSSNAESSLLRDLTDFVKDCEFDLILYHLDEIELSDIDNDNYGEITFGYRLNCTSDVSPSDQKVLLYENGDKYILRGTAEAIGYGGEYEVGDEFDSAPEGFLKKAESFWEENRVEFELEDNEF
ncbi:MAG: hypothetical protein GQ574_02445 [Crocinitomix sp.]|nr:hypothetical protein [Crocinitomix sp.]